MFFNITINVIDIECTLSKFVVDTKLSEAVDIKEGRDVVQSDFDRLEEWAHVNVRLIKAKRKMFQLS